MASTPLINGHLHDYATLVIHLDGEVIKGVASLNYKDSLDPGEARGNSPLPIGFTIGEYKAEGDFELYLRHDSELIKKLGNGFMQKRFDIVAQYRAQDGGELITDTLVGCRLKSNDASNSKGSDALVRKHDLLVHYIKWNGFNPLEEQFLTPEQ